MKKTCKALELCFFAATFSSIATGEVNDADGVRTGNTNTIGSGQKSGALGTNNSASGSSLAVGDANIVGGGGIAVGARNDIGLTSFSGTLGSDNVLEYQTNSFAFGTLNETVFPPGYEGVHNFMMGVGNKVDASVAGAPGVILHSILIGAGNTASDSVCWVFGGMNLGTSEAITLGMWAPEVSGASLILGNGTGAMDRTTALCTMKNGLTLLTNKTWDPLHPLDDPDDQDSSDADGVALEVEGHAVFKGGVIISEPQGDLSMGPYQ